MSYSNNTVNVLKARNNLLDILEVRGFNVKDYKGFSVNDVHTLIVNNTLDLFIENPESKKKAYIKFYNLEKTIRPSNIYELVEQIFNVENILQKTDDLIIIVKDEPNESLIKTLQQIYEHDGVFISLIFIDRLQFNILNHNLVPKMKVLNSDEKQLIKEKFNVLEDINFPTVSRFDPPSIVLGLRPGELLEITRKSNTSINSKFYRICSH